MTQILSYKQTALFLVMNESMVKTFLTIHSVTRLDKDSFLSKVKG